MISALTHKKQLPNGNIMFLKTTIKALTFKKEHKLWYSNIFFKVAFLQRGIVAI